MKTQLTHNVKTHAKETQAEKQARLLDLAKTEIDRIVTKAAQDPNHFGTPSVELVIQGGSLEAVKVNDQRSIK